MLYQGLIRLYDAFPLARREHPRVQHRDFFHISPTHLHQPAPLDAPVDLEEQFADRGVEECRERQKPFVLPWEDSVEYIDYRPRLVQYREEGSSPDVLWRYECGGYDMANRKQE